MKPAKNFLPIAIVVSNLAAYGGMQQAYAAELNKTLPKEAADILQHPVNINQPSQPLSSALKALGAKFGMNITFNDALVSGKNAPALTGVMSRKEALQKLLKNSGLEAKLQDTTIYIQRQEEKKEDKNIQLDAIQVRAKRFHEIGPLPGLGLTKEQIPGNVQSITAKEIKDSHSLSITDLMNKKLQSVTVNDYQGNPFQMDVQYRGFTAGPQIGTPQGLSVFFDGIRVNEPFGDIVNWDMIPMNAIAGVDVFPGSNPIFGLNTLGGAFTLKTKDGFTNEGVDAEVLTGSFGRKQLQVEGGVNNGTFALFGAGNFFLEDGWRENSPSKVNQFFGKASYRGDKLDLNLSTLLVGTDLVGNGLIPSEEYARNRNGVFTSPDTTKNRLQQFQLSSSYFVNDNFTVTGQVYRRDSKRKQKGADVFTNYDEELLARRKPNPGDPANGIAPEEYTCLFTTANAYGVPDYYVIPIVADPSSGADIFSSSFFADYTTNGFISPAYDSYKNTALPQDFANLYKTTFNYFKNVYESLIYNRGNAALPSEGPLTTYSFGSDYSYRAGYQTWGGPLLIPDIGSNVLMPYDDFYFYSTDSATGIVTKNYVIPLAPTNAQNCNATQATNVNTGSTNGGNAYTYADPNGGPLPTTVDGFATGQTGVVEGTPTGIITNNQIDQITDGASVQFNWNFEHHKFMVGASIDAASADYTNSQQLGFIRGNREVYLDPSQANPQFAGAFEPISNNNFEGTNTTKSIYFSETWTPVPSWNLNASGRYNQTKTKNKIAARYGIGAFGIGDVVAVPDNYNICPNGDCTNIPVNYRLPNILRALDKAETEKFSFYSFNPSLGATWQAKENLNIFANWAQGTRTPSVIELGCAFDKTPIETTPASDRNGDGIIDPPLYTPKSILENRQCTLPTTLSGDPYLPQIKATTYDVGMRGNLSGLFGTDGIEWNFGAYQTDLKDDIYFVAVGNGAGFFDTIGRTRRRGLEAGLSGKKDKWGFAVNYALTDATFEDSFRMISLDNSSSTDKNDGYGQAIDVKPGSKMPGVALHNLNANVSYAVTDKWTVGFTAVAHAESFVRGNENNEHRKGVARPIQVIDPVLGPITRYLQPTTNPGKVPGYATFNFQTSYKFNSEWVATMQINNLFDKEYFSAGRLGRNPFSPSILGAIGPDGYNHNSGDWLSTNFIAPGAPRGVWFSLNWQFDPNKK